MKALIKAFFAGGSTYAYIVLAAIVGAFLLERGHMKRENAALELQRDTYKAESLAKDTTIASQARTGARRSNANAQQQKTEDAILAATDGRHCGASEPIVIALDGLRIKQSSTAPDNPDK